MKLSCKPDKIGISLVKYFNLKILKAREGIDTMLVISTL